MTYQGMRLRHICFLGTDKKPAYIGFGIGLNVLCGASDTGKSFLISAIDFMLGASTPLEDIPERVGYDHITMGIEAADGRTFTLERSVEGGDFYCYEGLHADPSKEKEANVLSAKHSATSENNLSRFLLRLIDLDKQYIRKNAEGVTNSLSFRNIVKIVIINEEEIIKKGSPVESGQYTKQTLERGIFKLLMTGVDDSSIVTQRMLTQPNEDLSAKIYITDQLITEYRNALSELTDHPEEIENQLERLESSIAAQQNLFSKMQSDLHRLTSSRRELWDKREPIINRLTEMDELLPRFELLKKHYETDIDRLEAIKESGTFFIPLEPIPCPLCGAQPVHQKNSESCEGNVSAVVKAATAEIEKIKIQHKELQETVSSIQEERHDLTEAIEALDQEIRNVQKVIDEAIAPELPTVRDAYSELIEKRSNIKNALNLLHKIHKYEKERADLDKMLPDEAESEKIKTHLPTSVTDDLSQIDQDILQSWHFPNAERVYFDESACDLVISGKNRKSLGKGLRAITHAAFTIGLMDFCHRYNKAHPGFVLIDSPLLSYREPEGHEDDLRGTDLKDKFYEQLASLSSGMQIIIVENEHPPESILDKMTLNIFTGNPHSGRKGFFPE